MVPYVVLYESPGTGEHSLASLLPPGDCRMVGASSTEELLEALSPVRPQAVLFALSSDPAGDLVTLRLLRRVAPDIPLVVVAREASLEVRRLIQAVRPVYFAVQPVDAEELREALASVCPEARGERGPAISRDHERRAHASGANHPSG